MGTTHWIFVALAVASLILAGERWWRSRSQRLDLTQCAMIAALITLGVAALAYGSIPLTAKYDNVGLAVFHVFTGLLIGSVELLVLTLRVEHVTRTAMYRVMLRAGLVTAALAATWPLGFAFIGPLDALSDVHPYTAALVVHLIIFHGYAVWGLAQIVVLSWERFPREYRRRPIKAAALFMMGVGSGGYVLINFMIGLFIIARRNEWIHYVLALNAAFLTLAVAGAAVLAVGEDIYDEISARYQLARMRHLWRRVVELSDRDLHLAAELPAPARLQRAYVEISDALCTLRVAVESELTPDEAARLLRRGAVTTDSSAPTLSQALPPRATRQDDLKLIRTLAKAY